MLSSWASSLAWQRDHLPLRPEPSKYERLDGATPGMDRGIAQPGRCSPGLLGEALIDASEWLQFLPAADRRLFADEFAPVDTATAELDNDGPLSQLVREWRTTAEVYADPKLARRLRCPVRADGGPVSGPPTRSTPVVDRSTTRLRHVRVLQRRVAIARTLITDPEVIAADEPNAVGAGVRRKGTRATRPRVRSCGSPRAGS